jgi:hypothetical protein
MVAVVSPDENLAVAELKCQADILHTGTDF